MKPKPREIIIDVKALSRICKRESLKSYGKWLGTYAKVGRCLYCPTEFIAATDSNLDAQLKAHVTKECQKHPMRKIERELKRLKRKKRGEK